MTEVDAAIFDDLVVGPTLAVLGNSSSGKSTLFKALFQDCVGTIVRKEYKDDVVLYRLIEQGSHGTEVIGSSRSIIDAATNVVIRQVDLRLGHELCPSACATHLSLIHVPSLDQSGGNDYKTWITEHVAGLVDCLVVMMDGGLDVHTEAEVKLLKTVHTFWDSCGHVPVIFLCNKMEDSNEETLQLFDERRAYIQDLFQSNDDVEAASAAVATRILPISALHAYAFGICSGAEWSDFQNFTDLPLLKSLAKWNVGSPNWRRLSEQERVVTAFDLLTDSEKCLDGLATSGLDSFIDALNDALGGREEQVERIKSKALQFVSPFDNRVARIRRIVERVSDATVAQALQARFWELHETETQSGAASKEELGEQIREYRLLAQENGWVNEERRARERALLLQAGERNLRDGEGEALNEHSYSWRRRLMLGSTLCLVAMVAAYFVWRRLGHQAPARLTTSSLPGEPISDYGKSQGNVVPLVGTGSSKPGVEEHTSGWLSREKIAVPSSALGEVKLLIDNGLRGIDKGERIGGTSKNSPMNSTRRLSVTETSTEGNLSNLPIPSRSTFSGHISAYGQSREAVERTLQTGGFQFYHCNSLDGQVCDLLGYVIGAILNRL